jgi:hypothetical protein
MRDHPAERRRSCLVLMVFLVAGLVLSGQEGRPDDYQPAPALASEGFGVLADANDTLCCQRLAALIEQQKALISRETGQLRRELAALRNDLTRPGIREIVAGIGYIFGLAGVGLYLLARKTSGDRSDGSP